MATKKASSKGKKSKGINFKDPNSVIKAQIDANKKAADETIKRENPGVYIDEKGNVRKVTVGKDGVTVTQDYGSLGKSLMGILDSQVSGIKDLAGKPIYGTGDVSQDRKDMENKYIARFNEINAPQFEKDRQQLQMQLVNQGFSPQSQAYTDALFELDRRQNDATRAAAIAAMDRAGIELERSQTIDNSRRNQLYNEAKSLEDLLKGIGGDFPKYTGAEVAPANITGTYGVDKTSEMNDKKIAAEKEAQTRQAELDNATLQGTISGSPDFGSITGVSQTTRAKPPTTSGYTGSSILNSESTGLNSNPASATLNINPLEKPQAMSLFRPKRAKFNPLGRGQGFMGRRSILVGE